MQTTGNYKASEVTPERQARNRLAEERLELYGKLGKLERFINSTKYKELSRTNRELLKRQARLMSNLYVVLTKRLRTFEL